MRPRIFRTVLALAAVGGAVVGLAACSPGTGGNTPTTSAPSSTAPSSAAPDASPTTPSSDGLLPDETESPGTKPVPAPPSAVPAIPGKGDAELSILITPSPGASPASYTLVCQGGVPTAESVHPDAAAACAALKANPALLTRTPRPKDQACDTKYGGPKTALVTGAVDGVGVESSYKLTDGCEIAAWDGAKAVLGSSGVGE
ncbi:SSI family serine proteinase inhibitor [Arthrobacter silvisoli]|uniref:SSI family serine proteinase inhibitor n=1 Tax=Arthrobacter silvisoli TaxID=2291022 RepID=UPI000E2174A6|nr:SSI family serine proteinase inhibitor [Arthrobacter silvisoli]